MATKITPRLSTTTQRINPSIGGLRSTDPVVQAMLDATRRKQEEEEEKKRKEAAQAVSSSGSVGLSRAAAALPGAARLSSTDPVVQQLIENKAKRDATLAAWDAQRGERQEAYKKELQAAGGYYATLPQKSDWTAYSAVRRDVYDPTYRFINGTEEFWDKAKWSQQGYTAEREKLRYMTPEEINTYNYLYNKNIGNSVGRNVATDYLDSLSRQLNERQAQAKEEREREFAREHEILGSIGSVVDSTLGGFASAADLAIQGTKKLFTGEDIDYNTKYQQYGRSAENVRDEVANNIDSPVWKFLYQTGMSAADSLAAGMFGPLGGGALLGTSAGASAARDAHERGASDGQALLTGVLAGTAEALFEKFSIGNFKGLKEVPVTGIKSIAKNVAKSMAVNASEEAATELANTVTDMLVMGDISNYELAARNYMEQGLSEREAKKKAALDVAGQIGLAALAGGVMGTAFGGIGSVQSVFQNSRTGKTIAQTGNPQEVLNVGMGMAEGSDARKLAERLVGRQEAGKTLRNSEIGALYRENIAQNRAAQDTVTRLGKAFGREVSFYEDADAEQGGYAEDGKIYLNVNAPQAMMARFFTHELTHTAENSEAYNLLAADIRGRLGDSLAEMKQAKIERYAEKDTFLTDAGAEAEVIADYVAKNLFTNKKEITRLAQRNRNAALRVYDRIREWSAKVSGDTEKEFLLRAQRLYEKAMRETRGTAEGEKMFQFVGKNENGTEVYQTSESVRNLTNKEKMLKFINDLKNEYRGRTAKFERDGKIYYARMEESDARKNIYGDRKSDRAGYRAKLNAAADGDIFSLAENGTYIGSEEERGKNNSSHADVTEWDYFVKTAEIDGEEYAIMANVRLKPDGEYVYSLQLNQKSQQTGKAKRAYNRQNGEMAALYPVPSADSTSILQTGANGNTSGENVTNLQQSKRQMAFTDESDDNHRQVAEYLKHVRNYEAYRAAAEYVRKYEKTSTSEAVALKFDDFITRGKGKYAVSLDYYLFVTTNYNAGYTDSYELLEVLHHEYGFDLNEDNLVAVSLAMFDQAKRDGYVELQKDGTAALTEKGLELLYGDEVPDSVKKLRENYVREKIGKVARPIKQKDGQTKDNKTGIESAASEREDNTTPKYSQGFQELLSYIDTIPDESKRAAARAKLLERAEELDAYYRDRELDREIEAARGAERSEEMTTEAESQKGSEATEDLLQYAEEISDAEEVENTGDTEDWYSDSRGDDATSQDVQKAMDTVVDLLQQRDIETEYSRRHLEEQISVDSKAEKKPLRQRAREAKSFLLRKFVDSGEAVDRLGKAMDDKSLYHYYNAARASTNAGISMITDAQTDIYGQKVGKSLNDIFKPIRDKGDDYYTKFQLFLYHRHNIDRMSRVERAQSSIKAAQDELNNINHQFPYYSMMPDGEVRRIAESYTNSEAPLAQEYLKLIYELNKAKNVENKPVFGFDVGAKESREEVERLLVENPEFSSLADEVYLYNDNQMQYRVDSGLVSKEFAEKLKEIYPHYVPTFRVLEEGVVQQSKLNQVQIKKTVGRAQGGKSRLMPLHKAMAQQTLSAVQEGSKNRFGLRLMEDVWKTKRPSVDSKNVESMREALLEWQGPVQNEIIGIEEMENTTTADTFDDSVVERSDLVTNTFIIREGDKRWKLTVSPALYEAVDALSPKAKEVTGITKAARAVNDFYKKLITSLNPAFAAKNFLRDLQDAGLYAGSVSGFIKQYPEAWKQIGKNGELWQQYKALGGTYSSVFDFDTGTVKEKKTAFGKIAGRVEAANMAIEQAPRFAEFLSTRERLMKQRGETEASMETLMEAMYAAADITTNFGRSGTWGKMLNQNYIPFFNPSVQGFDKLVRWVSSSKTGKEWARLAASAAVFGIMPSVLNALLWGDDEEWGTLNSRDKDVYYLIKVGDGTWMKLPKGRAVSLFGMAANMAIDAAKGQDIDLEERVSTAVSQVAPMNPLKDNILKAWMDADLFNSDNPGRTWYGGTLESQRLQNYAPEDRYDEKTDELSKLIGKITKLSPKKINYLLDSYTGVLGDLILPLLTPRAERGLFSSSFLLDSKASNKLNGEFYDKLDELTYAKNKPGASGVDTVMYRFWNKQASAVSDINRSIREIEVDASLSDTEKKQMVRAQYDIRNALEQNAEKLYDQYRSAAEFWYERAEGEEDDRIDYAYLMANREVFGAEYALEVYNKSTYEKAQRLNAEGVSYEHFFYMQFTAKDAAEKAEIESNEMRSRIRDMETDDGEKKAIYRGFVSTTRDDDIEAFDKAGLTFDQFLDVQNAYTRINETYSSAGEKQEAFEDWIKMQGFTKKQRQTVEECFAYYWSIPADSQTKKQNSGISLPTMPEIRMPEIKLPELPQIKLPSFGG